MSDTSTSTELPGVGVGIGVDNSLPYDSYQTASAPPKDTAGFSNINTDPVTPPSEKEEARRDLEDDATPPSAASTPPLAQTATGVRTSTEITPLFLNQRPPPQLTAQVSQHLVLPRLLLKLLRMYLSRSRRLIVETVMEPFKALPLRELWGRMVILNKSTLGRVSNFRIQESQLGKLTRMFSLDSWFWSKLSLRTVCRRKVESETGDCSRKGSYF